MTLARRHVDDPADPAVRADLIDLTVERLRKTVKRLRSRIGQIPASLEPLIAELRETLGRRRSLRWISVLEGRELRFVTTDEILFFRSDHKYTAAVTTGGEHLVSRPLKQLVEELDPEVFWRVHRSYVVNLRAILSVRKTSGGTLEIVLRNHTDRIPVSQPYAHRFRHM